MPEIFATRLDRTIQSHGESAAVQLQRALSWSTQKLEALRAGSEAPKPDEIRAICDFLDVSAEYLLGRSDDPTTTTVGGGGPQTLKSNLIDELMKQLEGKDQVIAQLQLEKEEQREAIESEEWDVLRGQVEDELIAQSGTLLEELLGRFTEALAEDRVVDDRSKRQVIRLLGRAKLGFKT